MYKSRTASGMKMELLLFPNIRNADDDNDDDTLYTDACGT